MHGKTQRRPARPLSAWVPVVFVAVLGTCSALLVCLKPIMVPVVLETVMAVLLLVTPELSIKLILFSAGLPLSLFYERVGDMGGQGKPLFTEWGGTTPDGLRLIVGSILLCVLLLRLPRTAEIVHRFWPYALFLCFITFSVVYSNSPLQGVRLLLKITFPFLLFLALAQLLRSYRDSESFGHYWIAGGIASSLCAPVIALIKGPDFLFLEGVFRYNPGFIHPSPFSFYMLALFLYCYFKWRQRRSTFYCFLAIVFAVQTVVPMTRVSWAALALSLPLFELLYGRGAKKWLIAASAGLLPSILFYVLLWQLPAVEERVFQAVNVDSQMPAVELAQSVGLSGRGVVWLAGLEDFSSHNRLLGQGMGSSDHFFASLFEASAVAHNEYIRLLYDGGVVGVALFLFANIFLIRWLLKLRHDEQEDGRGHAALGVVLMISYLLIASTDNPLDYYLTFSQFVFFVLGICLAASYRFPTSRRRPLWWRGA